MNRPLNTTPASSQPGYLQRTMLKWHDVRYSSLPLGDGALLVSAKIMLELDTKPLSVPDTSQNYPGLMDNYFCLEILRSQNQAILQQYMMPSQGPASSSTDLIERHKKSHGYMRDSIIGLADGLTVPFTLTAGLSSIGSSKLAILGDLAELFAGSISMGLGAYLAAATELEHYQVELDRERRQVAGSADQEEEIMAKIFESYGVGRDELRPLVHRPRSNVENAGAGRPPPSPEPCHDPKLRSVSNELSAIVMGLAYFLGGFIPMIPYFTTDTRGLVYINWCHSRDATAIRILQSHNDGAGGRAASYSAALTLLIGGVAAAASYGLVKGVNSVINLK